MFALRDGLNLSALRLALAAAVASGTVACHDLDLSELRCSTSGRCPSGYACGADGICRRQSSNGRIAGPPGSKKQGEACAAGDECVTNVCADGVCCDGDCAGACRACNLPDNVGTCVAVARGAAAVHGGCARQPSSSCGTNGQCDGNGECQLYDDTTVCGDASCDRASNSFLPEAHCDGRGTCGAPGGGISCAPFTCRPDGKRCTDRCAGAGDCVAPNQCTNGSCGQIGNGLPCHGAEQCQSGFCVDGICCNAPCGEQCMACDVSASLGTCTQVAAGAPHGGRPACTGTGKSCAGQCTAASGSACSYPAAETICRSATCVNGPASATQTTAAACDGAGACGAGTTSACGVYMCGAGAMCATSCAGDFDCALGFICEAGVCQAQGTTASPCTATNQCAAGLTCKDGVCCESACADACRSCNLPGQTGHCVIVASGDDADTCPADTRTCDGAGACKLKDQQTCTGAADCASATCTTFYPDADGDGFGDRTAAAANRICGAAAPTGFVTNNGDCCDTAGSGRDAHPGQTAWFTTAGPCGIQFDYDCDGAMTPEYPAGGSCAAGGACTPGFVGANACGAMGDFQTCDQTMPDVCPAPAAQVQGCR